MSWLHAPLYLLQALAAQIPTLRAGEALQGAAEVALGTGSMKQQDLERTQRDWQRMADGDRHRAASRTGTTAPDWDGFAASSGIEMVKQTAPTVEVS